jgi:cold shock CspA family protein
LRAELSQVLGQSGRRCGARRAATRDDGLADVFIHISGLVDCYREIKEGDRVSLELGEHRGRPCAENVEILG